MILFHQIPFIFVLASIAAATAVADRVSPIEKRTSPTCGTTTVSPTPARLKCGAEGTERRPPEPIAVTTSDFATCRASCLNDDSCISFSYGPDDNCVTYPKKIIASRFRNGPTGMQFWNRHCFKESCDLCPDNLKNCNGDCTDTSQDDNNCGSCGTVCGAHTTCVNSECQCQLNQSIDNPGFDSGVLGPWSFQSKVGFTRKNNTAISIVNDTSTAYDGSYYANIYSADQFPAFTLSQVVPVCPGTSYQLTLHAISRCLDIGACTCKLQACVDGACTTFDPPGGDKPTSTVTVSYKSGSNDQATIKVLTGHVCERKYVRLDGFSLTPQS